MKNSIKNAFILAVCSSLGVGCAHEARTEKTLDQKLAQENSVKSLSDLRAESDRLVETAPGLTSEQRGELRNLLNSTRTSANSLREKSFQLRSLLVKSLLAKNGKPDETEAIKSQIRNVERQRERLFIETLHSTNTLLGRWASRHERESDQDFYNMMMLESYELW